MLVELTCYEVRRSRANGVNTYLLSTPEDRTDSLAHATGALLCFDRFNCCRVVVAGLAGHPGACADRSRGQAGMRLLRAFPRRPDAAQSAADRQSGADR